jgi:hypothetical protein
MGQSEVPEWDDAMLASAFAGVDALLSANPDTEVTFSTTPDLVDLIRKRFPAHQVIS